MSVGYQGPPELEGWMRAQTDAALEALGLSGVEVSLVLCDDAEIQPMNREWRSKDVPTDVLSFPQLDLDGPVDTLPARPAGAAPTMLGDIVISVETARRQAALYGHTPDEELVVLLLHGLLHLLGHTHDERMPRERMQEEEGRILSKIAPGYSGLVARGDPSE